MHSIGINSYVFLGWRCQAESLKSKKQNKELDLVIHTQLPEGWEEEQVD